MIIKGKKVLLLTTDYYPIPDANGICMHNIALSLINDNSVFCVCESNDNQIFMQDNVTIIPVKPSLHKRIYQKHEQKGGTKSIYTVAYHLYSFLRKLFLGFIFFIYPDVNFIRTKKLSYIVHKIVVEENIDIVIGSYYSYENIKCLEFIKNKNNNIITIAIFLDLLRGKKAIPFISVKCYDNLCYKKETKLLKKIDLFLEHVNSKEFYSNKKYSNYKDKIRYFDYPLYITSNKKRDSLDIDKIKIFYAGTLDMYNRNPNRIIGLLWQVKNLYPNFTLYIAGNVHCKEIFNRLMNTYPNLVQYIGLLTTDEVEEWIKDSDVLVNIGNALYEDMIPSKIFQLFSAQKPILNFIYSKNDKSIPCFAKYKYSCDIFYEDDNKTNIDKIYDYLKNITVIQKLIDKNDTDVCFEMNTPSFIIREIENAL